MEGERIRTAGVAVDYAALGTAFRAIAEAATAEDVPFAMLMQAIGLAGAAAGVLIDPAGTVRAAIPLGCGAGLPLREPGLAHLEPRQVTQLDLPGGRAIVALRWELVAGDDIVLLLSSPAGSFLMPERVAALPLLAAHATLRMAALVAAREADEAQARARVAHEQQVEMALRLYDLYEEAQVQDVHDGLTGLATHAGLQERLARELAEGGAPLSLLLFDLDDFATLNEPHGHQVGDRVLKEVATLLQGRVRASDLVARHGGDEFAILMPQTTEDEAHELADRLRFELQELPIDIAETLTVRATASIGLAAHGAGRTTAAELLRRAELALTAAKHAGRNRVVRARGRVAEAVHAIGAPRQGSEAMFLALAKAMGAAIEARSPMLFGHSEAVGELALKLAKALGLAPDKQEAMMIAGMLHDVGMLAVPEAVIMKPGALDAQEWAQMKIHPQAGVQILSRFSSFTGLHDAILYHHEQWDGSGYPEGLAGTAIPMGARILAICEAYDAMIRGDYAYGLGVPETEARRELARCAGSQFDPELVASFLGVLSGAGC